jgi:hypothetical protein
LYLDYELTGEILLGGQANQNTLRPPGSAPFTIGARLRTGQLVNRGFEGLIDEKTIREKTIRGQDSLFWWPLVLQKVLTPYLLSYLL